VCQKIVDDTISIVLDPLISAASNTHRHHRRSNSVSSVDSDDSPVSSATTITADSSLFQYSCIPHTCSCGDGNEHIVSGGDGEISSTRTLGGSSEGDLGVAGNSNGFHLLIVDGPNEEVEKKPVLWSNTLVDHVRSVISSLS
jgi:hypothetical protein